MWIQDWSGKIVTGFGTRVFWNWRWNETWYPELDNVIKELREDKNIRVTAYITAHLNIEGDIYKQNASESLWLTNERGETVIQDYGSFDVSENYISCFLSRRIILSCSSLSYKTLKQSYLF